MGYHHTNKKLRSALVGAVGSVLAVAAPASATPAKPAPQPTEDPTAVKTRIAALYRQAEQLTQTYDAAQEQGDRLTIAVQRSQTALDQGRADYQKRQAELGQIASAQYRTGNLDRRLEILLAEQPDAFLSSAAVVDRLSDEQLRKIALVVETQRELIQLQRTAADQIAALVQTRTQAATARHDVQTQLHQAQTLLNTLSAPQRRAVAAADLGTDGTDLGTPVPTTGFGNPEPTGRARTAIEAAFANLGKPYVYGAEGPDAFDCSGLIQRVYRQAGVELPRTSSEQATAGRIVPVSAIEPGDLVLYYQGRNHIGLYIGDGKIIHAPHPGSQVRISPLNSMPVNMVVRV
jgi:cell wall-associated NlpC family hydrolase